MTEEQRVLKVAKDPIYVTRPSLPQLERLAPMLDEIWESAQVTNGGAQAAAFEHALGEYLGVEHLTLCCNGTIALLCALRACNLPEGSEVITTPYSFVATAGAIVWAGLKPVFVDVDEDFNISPQAVAEAISHKTSAILPVHCYGRPCKTEALQSIAESNGLSLIYDSAHAFGADCHCGSLMTQGHLSTVSFHATKVFNTFEGGCIITPDAGTKKLVDQLINFGFRDETTVVGIGINGKMNEFNAALGRLQLESVDAEIERCQNLHRQYHERLGSLRGLRLPSDEGYRSNYSYFPVLVNDEAESGRDRLYEHLRDQQIFARRYFYPLITDFPDYSSFKQVGDLHTARYLSDRVLCLPLYSTMAEQEQDRVCESLISILGC